MFIFVNSSTIIDGLLNTMRFKCRESYVVNMSKEIVRNMVNCCLVTEEIGVLQIKAIVSIVIL